MASSSKQSWHTHHLVAWLQNVDTIQAVHLEQLDQFHLNCLRKVPSYNGGASYQTLTSCRNVDRWKMMLTWSAVNCAGQVMWSACCTAASLNTSSLANLQADDNDAKESHSNDSKTTSRPPQRNAKSAHAKLATFRRQGYRGMCIATRDANFWGKLHHFSLRQAPKTQSQDHPGTSRWHPVHLNICGFLSWTVLSLELLYSAFSKTQQKYALMKNLQVKR